MRVTSTQTALEFKLIKLLSLFTFSMLLSATLAAWGMLIRRFMADGMVALSYPLYFAASILLSIAVFKAWHYHRYWRYYRSVFTGIIALGIMVAAIFVFKLSFDSIKL